MKENIDYVTAKSRVVSPSKRTESRKRATTNLDLKIIKKMNLCNTVNHISMEDNILDLMIFESDKKPMAFLRTPTPHKVKKKKERG